MSFFIPKDVVEKLKEAEKINNATKDLEKINDIARKISKDYFDQIEMFKTQKNLANTSIYQSLRNYEQELKAINKVQESVGNMMKIHENIRNIQKYNDILNQVSQEMETKKEIYKSIENIKKQYDLFDSLKKATEEVNFHKDISNNAEQSKSNKYLMSFLKKINND